MNYVAYKLQSHNYYLRMPKFMHQIVLFIEPNEREYKTPFKIGSKFMNLCAIDEDAGFEIVKILELGKKKNLKRFSNFEPNFQLLMAEKKRKQKGIALIIVT